ncbi:hypothetical protein SAMN06265375_102331 [Muriicola jejuensis]|uniref:Uncharacterized protein n=1 Tax=Muriicola jejuensis TaxID=504488 RepID=A0A6P0UBM6_9FLAO|nr:hypothetical protein [Muriicola jejuensis]NER10691.1 hypothetical protein [Muriicola jejuensis]SMP16915.1 hypothetical protein SAMN06265375_102331 [Muriicola jejuensis]
MTTFFTIFFILVAVNAGLLTFSMVMNKRRQSEVSGERTDTPREKIYPLDLSSSEYRKAI